MEEVKMYPMLEQFLQIDDFETGEASYEHGSPYQVTILPTGVPVFNSNKRVLDVYGNKGIFVMDDKLNLYFGPRSGMHHSDFFKGAPVACAGQYVLSKNEGRLLKVDNQSGHYQPELACLRLVDSVVRKNDYKGVIKYTEYKKVTAADIIGSVKRRRPNPVA